MIRLIPPVPVGDVHTVGIGVFDGVHVGHQAILRRSDAMLTFFPHPDLVLGKETLQYLTVIDEMRLIFPRLFVMAFDLQVAKMAPESFLNFAIRNTVAPKRIIVGADFRFGSQKAGDADLLRQWGQRCGIKVEVLPLMTLEGETVKSSKIRSLLAQGDIDLATRYLGRPYLILGQVVSGEGRGYSLGFPTANLVVEAHKLVPKSGVYSGKVDYAGQSFSAMIYIGSKPTFGEGGPVQIEVFLNDFSGDLYGRKIAVWISHRIRDDQKFESKEALIAQIHADIAQAKGC